MRKHTPDRTPSASQWGPNARLIASAPEMLEAIKTCYEFFKEGSPVHPDTIQFSDDDSVDAEEFFRRLIAKAEGRLK